ncbi:hypothetical protein EsH8_I_000487 [Colletotrichum jinshuiense]
MIIPTCADTPATIVAALNVTVLSHLSPNATIPHGYLPVAAASDIKNIPPVVYGAVGAVSTIVIAGLAIFNFARGSSPPQSSSGRADDVYGGRNGDSA